MTACASRSTAWSGFCLLIRRAVIEAIGLLDEQFGIGCFEDDDYCLRAIQAGYRAVIAADAFVHHFGGRTFAGQRGRLRGGHAARTSSGSGRSGRSGVEPAASPGRRPPARLSAERAEANSVATDGSRRWLAAGRTRARGSRSA